MVVDTNHIGRAMDPATSRQASIWWQESSPNRVVMESLVIRVHLKSCERHEANAPGIIKRIPNRFGFVV
jgi:hypothetical protein